MQLKDAKLFRQQAYVDGAWVDADNGQTIKVNNPATGEIIGSVPKMGAAETRRAIEAADKALPAWRALTALNRNSPPSTSRAKAIRGAASLRSGTAERATLMATPGREGDPGAF